MDAYRSVLERIARRDLLFAIIASLVCLLILGTVWILETKHFRKMKKEHPKQYNSEKQVKLRRQSWLAATALTVIFVAMIAFLGIRNAKQIVNIREDIEECAYITYVGDYYISPNGTPGRRSYGWRTVSFGDAGYASLYVDYWEGWLSDVGDFKGTVIYGEHSLIVVYIDGDET